MTSPSRHVATRASGAAACGANVNGADSTTAPALRPLLDRLAWLAPLPARTKDRLAAMARQRHFAAGAALFRRGETADGLLLVLDGLVRLHVSAASGREMTIGLLGRGEPVGEIACTSGAPRGAEATAMTPVAALLLHHADVQAMVVEEPTFALALLMIEAARLRQAMTQMEALALHTMQQRLAGTLLHLAAVDPYGLVRLSQGQIASLVAASRPKVNLALAAFRGRGLVATVRAGLRLTNPLALRALAEQG